MINNGLKGIDTSLYDGGGTAQGTPALNTMDWGEYASQGWYYAFIKVSQANFADPLFDLQWEAARGKIYRSGYHFFKPDTPVVTQVQVFCDLWEKDPGELPPVLDLETTDGVPGRSVSNMALDWLGATHDRLGVKPIVYSSTYFLRDVIYSGSFPEFADYELWLAQYFYDNMSDPARAEKILRVLNNQDPIIFPSAPAPWSGIPEWFQWTAKGSYADVPGYYTGYGHKKSVDFNWSVHKSLDSLKTHYSLPDLPDLPPIDPDPDDKATQPYDGVTHITGRRYDSDFHLILADTSKPNRTHVTNTGGYLRRVGDMARSEGAQIAVNCDDWDKLGSFPHIPSNMAWSDGNEYRTHNEFVPFVNFNRDSRVDIQWNDFDDLYNVASGIRYLIEGGSVKDYLEDPNNPDYNQVLHPRTGIATHVDGRFMIVVVDGRSETSAGCTLLDLARLLEEFGAYNAFDADGGGSSALWVGDKIVNIPSDGAERAVVNHILLFYEEENPPMPETYLELTPNVSGEYRSVRDDSNYQVHIEGDKIGQINAFSTGKAVLGSSFTYTEDVISDGSNPDVPAGNLVAKAGDIWHAVFEANGNAIDGWAAEIHLGRRYLNVEQIGEPTEPPIDPEPPVDPEPAYMDVYIPEGGYLNIKDKDGNTIFEWGTPPA
jgi:hypothetical protein